MIPLLERLRQPSSLRKRVIAWVMHELRVSVPGIIQSFDPVAQTVTVQPAVKERVNLNGLLQHLALPLLVDVPIKIPRAGGWSVTLPIQKGDECLVVFGDQCMDAWWQSGGVQQAMCRRRHDLSDGYALIGITSKPNALGNYSTDSLQIRDDAADTYMDFKPGLITVKTDTLKFLVDTIETNDQNGGSTNTIDLNGKNINVTGASGINLAASGNTVIESRNFIGHEHDGVTPGSGDTGGVV